MGELPRGTVTLLFTDIEGSTRLLQRVGERYADILEACRHLLRTAFHQYHGHKVDMQGDAFFVAFARASDAVAAAVTAQRSLASQAWPEGITVRVRMGLHTGEPSLKAEGYVGLDVHRAARIMSAGHGGQILLSQTTRDLVEHHLPEGTSLIDLGAHRLKDLEQPSHLYQIVTPDFPPLKTLDTHTHNLPIQPTPLIGREQQIAVVQHLLQRQDVRLLTLTGPGGIGKTRLGLQVAAELSDHFLDGVYFVNLAPVRDSAFVLPTIAQTLEVKEMGSQSPLELLQAALREKHLLLLLDNVEQVVQAAPQVAELLSTCSKLKILVTSRMSLHVRAEQEFAVSPLRLPDPKRVPDLLALSQYEAVALFIQRAQAVKVDFQISNASAPAVAEICYRLDGLPLAIELAAARSKLFSPSALLARLGQRLNILTAGARDAPARQQTLRDTIAWSYHLLDAAEQKLFQRLSVFVGGCTLEAIEVVCFVSGDAEAAGHLLDTVASLVDKSLLQQHEQEGEEGRFVMLETIREYGMEVLSASGELEALQDAHAAYYVALAEQAELELGGPKQVAWLERLDQEHGNVRVAFSWALEQGRTREAPYHREQALRLVGALRDFWELRGYLNEGVVLQEQALAARTGVAPAIEAKALISAADMAFVQGNYRRGEMLAQEALILSTQLDDTSRIAFCLYLLGNFTGMKGEYEKARSFYKESIALYREVGNKERLGWSLWARGTLELSLGTYETARVLFEEALALFRELGNKMGTSEMLVFLALTLFFSGGDVLTARSMSEEALALAREVGNPWMVGVALMVSARLILNQDGKKARELLQESIPLFREIDLTYCLSEALSLLAQVEALQEHYEAARCLAEESVNLARQVSNEENILFPLEVLAQVAAAQEETVWAVRLWGAAASLREALGYPLPAVYQASYEQAIAEARTHIGENSFARVWSEGYGMKPEEVMNARGPVRMPESLSTGQSVSLPLAHSVSTYPDGLTVREVEVLRLVARGLTDAQVAERLVISPRTVNSHLTSIYNKIQVSSRAAATRYAIEHQLV